MNRFGPSWRFLCLKRIINTAKPFFRYIYTVIKISQIEHQYQCILMRVQSLLRTGKRFVRRIGEMGVRVLRNEYVDLPACRLIGLKQRAAQTTLSHMLSQGRLNLVLAHRPERFPIYAEAQADVVLSGHAHGGQIRLFGRGIYAPQQGFFPRYTAGQYKIGRSVLYVSRGLGNTIPFPRVFNTPELNRLVIRPDQPKGE